MMPTSLLDNNIPRKPVYSPEQARLLLLTLALVCATTWALFTLQNALQAREHSIPLRPFTIGYLLPLFVITTLGGRWFGRIALGLSALLAVLVLAPPEFSFGLSRPRDWAELSLFVFVGETLIRGVDAIRRDMALREDVEQSPFTAALLAQAKDAACRVPGVQSVGHCTFRRRGIEYYLDVDIFVSGSAPLRDADRVAHDVQKALHGVYRLIRDVRVRLRPAD